jgi:hypothetical protein
MQSYQEPKSPRERVTFQPAVMSPKRVPDRQMGQPSFVLGGQSPITVYYVNVMNRPIAGYGRLLQELP